MSVKLSLICLFLELDLDYLLAVRTAPYHSFRNPAERIMSILNLGLQSVGLARASMSKEMEDKVGSCNSVSEIRRVAKNNEPLRDSLLDSVSPAKTLLSMVTQRLQLKGKKFTVNTAAQIEAISDLWAVLKQVDPRFDLQHCDKVSERLLTPGLKDLISHCYRQRHYFFEIKKCGKGDCTICSPVRMPMEEFDKIKPFPDPMMKDDGHYKGFTEVYGTKTSESCRPSKQAKVKKLPFNASLQDVKNSSLMLMCEECGMWRLVYATRKLSAQERRVVEASLDGLSFSCGSQLNELDLHNDLLSVMFVRDSQCNDPVEALYYSVNYTAICMYCCADMDCSETVTSREYYPQCEDCATKNKISRKCTHKK